MPPFLRNGPDSVANLNIDDVEAALARAAQTGNQHEELRCCGLLAEIHRATGRDGRPMAERALQLARVIEDRVAVHRNRIRLATAMFYVECHDEAESMLRSTVDEIEADGQGHLLDFAYQHLGKCLAEQARYDEAVEYFNAALDLRTDRSLRQSSQQAIELARTLSAEV